jgi:hypothetical protein
MRPTLILPKQYVARDILSLFVPTVIALSQELIETSIDDNEPILECFIAGTKILMADGTEKNIEEVQIGEKLLGANGSTNTVLAYQRPILENDVLYSINDKNYFVTASHPFMTTEGWKSINPAATHQEMPSFDVAPLQIGDVLITSQGNTTITSLSTSVPMAQVQLYNFVVDGNHTYYANNYLVHNKTMTTVCNYTTSSACNNDTSCMWLATIEVMGTCQ